MSTKELASKTPLCVSIDHSLGSVTVRDPALKEDSQKMFTFDYAFGVDAKQEDVYDLTARPIVDATINGYNGTIFAYGELSVYDICKSIDRTNGIGQDVFNARYQRWR